MQDLPVAAVLDPLVAALRDRRRVVLKAPPGSGKTTLVPIALHRAGFTAAGELVLLQPRRVAARTVAAHLARRLGEPVGRTVGYQVRLDTRASRDTRIRVVTEGILTARLQGDPELSGVQVVVLDEFHERSLHADLALAFVKEVQDALRDDLALVVMSATLDPGPIARYLDDCPVIETAGRQHPVEVVYLDRPDERPLPQRVAGGVRRVIDEGRSNGDVLAFLPGVRDIEATAGLLQGALGHRGWELARLHGRLPPEAQDQALRPTGRPRVILSTNLAETSLTIEGVAAVVDSGWAKTMRHDPGLGLDRLEPTRISLASADQRAGRAGRLGPGFALRLWTEHEHRSLQPFDLPEIRRVDLAQTLLEIRGWGVNDASRFPFYEAPDPSAVERAEALLALLGLTEGPGAPLTELGRRALRIPAHPRVGRTLLAAADHGWTREGALLAALAQEPDVGAARGGEPLRVGASDLLARRERLRRDPSTRGGDHVRRLAEQLADAVARVARPPARTTPPSEDDLCELLLSGWPDRVARRRGPGSDALVMVGGRGLVQARESCVKDDAFLIALEVDAGRRGAFARSLVRAASRVDVAWLEAHPVTRTEETLQWDAGRERVVATRARRYMDLVLDEAQVPIGDREAASQRLLEAASADPRRALAPSEAVWNLLRRVTSAARWAPEAGLPSDADALLRAVLPALVLGRASFAELRAAGLQDALLAELGWEGRKRVEALAPAEIPVPSGRTARLAYQDEGPPVLSIKVQELFGLAETPTVGGGRQPVVLHLLNPAGRPLQVTSDLASFWSRTWPEVRKEMRSRYPKHHWPEDPWSAQASQRSLKPRG